MANSSSPPSETLHLVFVPFLAPGHFIPMIDMAKLIAKRGVTATVFTTPVIASSYGQTINQPESISIRFVQVPFPCDENGMPEGCETLDKVPSGQILNYMAALNTWQTSVEHFVEQMEPFPNSMITDRFLPIVAETAKKLGIRRVMFDGMGCLSLLVIHQIDVSGILESVVEAEVPFAVPGLPHKIELTKQQLPIFLYPNSPERKEHVAKLKEANSNAYGILINSFEELEHDYIKELRKLHKNRAWCVGPLSLSNKENSEMARRGDNTSIGENECLKWLDRQLPGSVIYVCLGSLCRMKSAQMSELSRALLESNRPFIWVIRETEKKKEMEKWYKERTPNRGLLVWGWAPQVLILSHKAVGGFVTHCGWNSTMEGISCGVPMITWPLFGEQFFNEKLIVQVLGTGVRVGVSASIGDLAWQKEEEEIVLVKSEMILEAIDKVMTRDGLRRRAKELGEAAKRASQEGGSSYNNITLFLQDIAKPMTDSSKPISENCPLYSSNSKKNMKNVQICEPMILLNIY